VWTKAEEHVVIEPIIIDFCDNDSDDDTGWSIIILSKIVRKQM
jgi:hypothetical protein